jgi:hypothetical protein
MSPFSEIYDLKAEMIIVKQAQEGSQKALEKLVKLHQRFIYNVALKLVRDTNDAEDRSQEAIVKMITKLNQFSFEYTHPAKSLYLNWSVARFKLTKAFRIGFTTVVTKQLNQEAIFDKGLTAAVV